MFQARSRIKYLKVVLYLTLSISSSAGFAQKLKVQELQKKISTKMADTARLSLLKNLSIAYTKVDPIKKLEYARIYEALAIKLNRQENVADAYIHMGISYGIRSNIDSALYYFNKAYIHAEKFEAKMEMGRALANSAYAYTRFDDNKEAINRYFRALKIYKEIGNELGETQLNTNIGGIYADLEKYKIAQSYFQQALNGYKKLKNENGMADALYSMGNSSRELGEFDKALNFYNQSLNIHERLGDFNGIALAKMGLGQTYTKLKDYDRALVNLDTALVTIRKLDDKFIEINVLNALADVQIGAKDYSAAIEKATLALKISRAIKSKNMSFQALERLILAYKEKGDLKNAFDYQNQYVKTRDSIGEDKALKDVSLIEINRIRTENADLEKRNDDIAKLNSNYLQRLDKYSNLIIVTLLFLIALLLFLAVLYRRNLAKQALNKELMQKSKEIAGINHHLKKLNEELNAQIKLTNEQNLELENLNNIKNKFFSIISHDLRSPLNTLTSLMAIYREGDVTEDELREMLLKLEDTIINTGSFLNNLLEWSKNQLKGIVINPVKFEINKSVNHNITLFERRISQKKLKVVNDTDPACLVYADPDMINVVIRNLLSNSIKFCMPGDEITFNSFIKERNAVISIKDTGPGISKAQGERLFNLDNTVSTSNGEKGNHLGLILCKDMILQNNGSITFESSPGEGTTFWIELPNEVS